MILFVSLLYLMYCGVMLILVGIPVLCLCLLLIVAVIAGVVNIIVRQLPARWLASRRRSRIVRQAADIRNWGVDPWWQNGRRPQDQP